MCSCCFTLYRAYSISFNSSNVGEFSVELNSEGLYQSLGKEKEGRSLVFTSFTKRKISQFHVVVMQRRQINVPKSVVHVRSFWFCLLNLLLFGRSCCRRRRRCLSSLFNANRPFPSSKKSHFQNEAKCETFVVKMSFICIIIKTHFHINGFALSLALKVRFFGTREMAYCRLCQEGLSRSKNLATMVTWPNTSPFYS